MDYKEKYDDLYDADELKNVKPRLISILHSDFRPSNRQGVFIKSEKDNTVSIEAEVTKFEEDGLKGLLYVTPMKALYKDTDGEFYSNETVEKSAHWFAKNVGLYDASDTNHNFDLEDGVVVVETSVDKSEDAWEWKAVIDISDNSELMELAKAGKITGVSIAGTAELVQKEDTMFNKLYKRLKEHFEPRQTEYQKQKEIENNKEENMNKEEIMELIAKGKEESLEAIKNELPNILAEIKKQEEESEEVKKAEQEKIEKEEKAKTELEELKVKVEELTKSVEEKEKAIKDLEEELAVSKQSEKTTVVEKEDKNEIGYI